MGTALHKMGGCLYARDSFSVPMCEKVGLGFQGKGLGLGVSGLGFRISGLWV